MGWKEKEDFHAILFVAKLKVMTNHVLKLEARSLQLLMSKLVELNKLHQLMIRHLPSEIAKHCEVVRFEKNCLFLIVENGNWATQLRFQIPSLMSQLKQYPGLESLGGIICKTYPDPIKKVTKVKKKNNRFLSKKTAEAILQSTQSIRDQKLRSILEKIASYTIPTNTRS